MSLLYTTSYHPQADGASECTNATAEIALRYYISTLADIKEWPTVLLKLQAALNNLTKYSSTSHTPTEVLYGFKTRKALDLMRVEENEDSEAMTSAVEQNTRAGRTLPQDPLEQSVSAHPANTASTNDVYKTTRIDARDTIAFAAMRMKEYYDGRHKSKFFKVGEHIHIRLHKGYGLPGVTHHKINQQFTGPLKVVGRIR